MNETKTATKHTPGKWVANGIRVLNENEDAVIAKVANSADTTTKWQCCTASFENADNARLIAASPDLLEALQMIVRGYELSPLPGMDSDIAAARAAIARATGGAA